MSMPSSQIAAPFDVEKIREAFVQQLLGMYHQRIAYPQNKIVEIESRRAAGGGPGA